MAADDFYTDNQSDERRARNRAHSPEILTAAGIAFSSHNGGAHLIVSHADKTVDFWPGTGLWHVRDSYQKGRGVFVLCRYLKNREKICVSTTVEQKIKDAEEILTKPPGATLSGPG